MGFFAFVFESLTECKSTLVRANEGGTGGMSVCVVSYALDSVCVSVCMKRSEAGVWGH